MSDQEIYKKFIEYMDNPLSGWTPSEHLMPMVTSYITPEEAEFMIGLPFRATSVEDIATTKNMDPEKILIKLNALCAKGLVYEIQRGDSSRYRMLDNFQMFFRMPYWHGKETEELENVAHHANAYYMEGFIDHMDAVTHKGLRSIPINQTIEDRRGIMPFEDIIEVVDNYEYYTVSHCPCRHRHKLDSDHLDSGYPSETCLHFDELGHHIVKHGLGREITKEETIEILKKSADAGLVHGISNQEVKPDTICNCDPQYCTVFRPYHMLGHKKGMDQSNYQVTTNPEKCKACGLCMKRCPMDAISYKTSDQATNKYRKAVVVDTDLCVGCGVCVHKCPSKSITLERREETTRPPKTGRDWQQLFVSDIMAAKEKQAE